MKLQSKAMEDFSCLVEDPLTHVKVKVNALIKRASLYIQQCKDPKKDPELSFADFALAAELDPENADIYHHRLDPPPPLVCLTNLINLCSLIDELRFWHK